MNCFDLNNLLAYVSNIITCRFPFVCVSIGLTIGKVPIVGVVYNPIMNEVRILVPWEHVSGYFG